MVVIITGGGGFVGSHLAEFHLSKGDDVLIIDNFSRNKFNYNYLKKLYPKKLSAVKADVEKLLTSKKKLLKSFKDASRVYHCAAQVTMTDSVKNPLYDHLVNDNGTFNVCELIRLSDSKSPIVFSSTNKVYGSIINKTSLEHPRVKELPKRYVYYDIKGVSEDDYIVGPDVSNCPYGGSKMRGEVILQDFYETYGIPAVRARMSCVYGTRQFGIEDQGWLSWFTIRILLRKPITIYGDGKQVRDVLFVSDHVKAFDSLCNNISKTKGKAFNLGGGPNNTLSLLELLEIIESATGIKPNISFADWRHGDQKVYISDISKLTSTTGWSPKVSPVEGVKKLVDWTKENIKIF